MSLRDAADNQQNTKLSKEVKIVFWRKMLTKFQSDVKLRKSLEGDEEMVFEN